MNPCRNRVVIALSIGLVVLSSGANAEEAEEAAAFQYDTQSWIGDDDLRGAERLVERYRSQAQSVGEDNPPYWTETVRDPDTIPADFRPWWQHNVVKPLSATSNPIYENPESLVLRAVANSAQIRVFSDIPIVRETAELEAKGRFDPRVYLEGKLTDLNEPVGSTLKTGGPDRFLEDEWLLKAGIKKKFLTGTDVDVSQRWGVLDNNSEFLEPKDQANTRLAFTITQPLLNGFGVKYNRTQIDIARIDGRVALSEFKRQVESHLLEVIRAYWGVYLERAALLQRRALLDNTGVLVTEMEGRGTFDTALNQQNRVRAKLAARRSDLVRAETAVRNAEARVLSLVNDNTLVFGDQFELIPDLAPVTTPKSVSTEMAMTLALENRPEIDQAIKQLKAAALRSQMTRRELMPVLNLVFQYYRDGLEGDDDVSGAYSNQFDVGDGSYVLGLVFEYPLFNREARARHRRRQVEVRQLQEQLRTTLETVSLELQVSTREVKTAYREMLAKYLAMKSAQVENETLEQRQGVDLASQSGAVYIELLLDAQDRLSEAEYEFLQSQVTYNVALVNSDRATGTLLQMYDIEPRRIDHEDGLPAYRLEQVSIAQ